MIKRHAHVVGERLHRIEYQPAISPVVEPSAAGSHRLPPRLRESVDSSLPPFEPAPMLLLIGAAELDEPQHRAHPLG
jgi:hypothetical protein